MGRLFLPPAAVLALSLSLGPSARLSADFIRGDANRDGRVDIGDAVAEIQGLFSSARFPCEDAADVDDDGALGMKDPLAILEFSLAGRPAIPSPGPALEGPDPTCDPMGCGDSPDPTPAVVLNEIHYHPADSYLSEYVELHNRSGSDVDLEGYVLAGGIEHTFPPGTVIPAGGFLIVARDPARAELVDSGAPVAGPFRGALADGPARLTLASGDCLLEAVRYDDRRPWPTGADGYGGALERVAPLAPASDYHSWRASLPGRRTPGAPNSVLGTPSYPLITSASTRPEQPGSADPVAVEIELDAPLAAVRQVTLRWETVARVPRPGGEIPMAPVAAPEGLSRFTAALPPAPSQTLVRYNVAVELSDGRVAILPHEGDAHPFLSYFVYDFELESRLPVLWLLPAFRSSISSRSSSGVVIEEPGAPALLLFDGARIVFAHNGRKVKFLHGEEYRGDRTLNILPEQGGGGTGLMAPHMEHLGFETFRALGALAPRAEWFRVVDYTFSFPHGQRLVVEQVNETFLAKNGLHERGDLYKMDKNEILKHTNLERGTANLDRLREALGSADPDRVREAVLTRLDLDNVRLYSVVSVLVENWDGFHNNLFLYQDGSELGRWQVIPWDLDQVFEPCCYDFPITYPLDGVFPGNGRTRSGDYRILSQPFHSQADLDHRFRDDLRAHIRPGGRFSVEVLTARIDAIEALLLEDLALQERDLGITRDTRRGQILSSYAALREYVARRIPHLESVLD